MWFNKKKEQPAGPVTRPLSFERVHALFVEKEWPYLLEGSQEEPILRTQSGGIISSVFAVDLGITVLRSWPLKWLTEERFPEVLAWVEGFNNNSPFPTVLLYQDEGDNYWNLSASFLIPDHWEYTDAQLEEWVKNGIFGVMDVGNDFFTAFNLENPDAK